MCKEGTFIVVSVAVLAWAATARATDRGDRETAASATSVHVTRSNGDLSTTASKALSEPCLQIENVRLVSSPAEAPQPSVVLKFDVFNDTTQRLTDVVMRVSFVEKRQDNIDTASPRVIVGPVTIRVGEILRAGYILSYEMLFRNLSRECNCAPRIEILSARLMAD